MILKLKIKVLHMLLADATKPVVTKLPKYGGLVTTGLYNASISAKIYDELIPIQTIKLATFFSGN